MTSANFHSQFISHGTLFILDPHVSFVVITLKIIVAIVITLPDPKYVFLCCSNTEDRLVSATIVITIFMARIYTMHVHEEAVLEYLYFLCSN